MASNSEHITKLITEPDAGILLAGNKIHACCHFSAGKQALLSAGLLFTIRYSRYAISIDCHRISRLDLVTAEVKLNSGFQVDNLL